LLTTGAPNPSLPKLRGRGVAYLFGEEINRMTGPVRLLLLVGALALVLAGILFFRQHEREFEQRADAALRGM
jgi:hypothetical protein